MLNLVVGGPPGLSEVPPGLPGGPPGLSEVLLVYLEALLVYLRSSRSTWRPSWSIRDPPGLPEPREAGLTQGHAGGRSVVVDPEGDPGQDGDQDGGHVRLQDEVSDVPLDPEAERQAGVGAFRRRRRGRRGRGGHCVNIESLSTARS